MKKLLLSLLLALALFFSITAGSPPTGNADSVTSVGFRLGWWTNEVRTKITKDIVDLYLARNPGIDIELEFTGWGSYWDKLATQAAASNLPDIIQMDLYGYLALYVDKNQLLPLDDLVAKGIIDLSGLDLGPVENGKIDNILYAIPLGAAPQAAIYDPAIFREAGITPPAAGWTWEDYETIGYQLKDKLGIYLDSFQINNLVYEFQTYVKSFGAELYNHEGQLGFTKQLLLDYLNMKLRLTDTGILPAPDILLQHKELENSLLVVGKAAMFSDAWSTQLGAVEAAAGRSLDLLTRPSGTRGGIFNKPSMYWCITKNCNNPEAAAAFINFWVNDVEANKIGTTNRGVPASQTIREAIAPVLDESSKKVMKYIGTANTIFAALPPGEPAKAKEVADLFNELAEKVLFKNLTPQAAADAFFEKAPLILAE